MLHDLDKTLKVLLETGLPPELASSVHILFGAPDGAAISTGNRLPAINAFLYDIKEDLSQRRAAPEVERRSDGQVVRTWPPAVVDCHYLITAWSGAEDEAAIADEHRLLGAVMKTLLRYRVLPEQVLQGELAALGLPISAWLLQPDQLRGLGEFWQILGKKPRAALSYRVSIQVPSKPEEPLEALAQGVALGISIQS